jgi:hypothetical protein
MITTAAVIPVVSAAYLWLCVALLPGKSLFGDIAEPLPNGYTLKALGKMPDFASIDSPRNPNSYNGLSECIGKLAVYGPLVVGRYSHPFGSFSAKEDEPYFMFDTRDGRNVDVASLAELESDLGHCVQLVEVQFFRSREPAYLRQQRLDLAIEICPPVFAVVILMALVFRSPRETAA